MNRMTKSEHYLNVLFYNRVPKLSLYLLKLAQNSYAFHSRGGQHKTSLRLNKLVKNVITKAISSSFHNRRQLARRA